MTTKELKKYLLDKLQERVNVSIDLIYEDMQMGENTAYDNGQLRAYREVMSVIEDIPSENAEKIPLVSGYRYKCKHNLHFEGGEGIMFSKGTIYCVVCSKIHGVGIMDNENTIRSHSTGCTVLTTEHFELVND